MAASMPCVFMDCDGSFKVRQRFVTAAIHASDVGSHSVKVLRAYRKSYSYDRELYAGDAEHVKWYHDNSPRPAKT